MSKKTGRNPRTYKSTAGTRVVVGHDEYVNQRTGEVEEFAVMRVQQADWNFEKIWLFRLLEALNLTGSAKVKVLTWMLDNRDQENRIIATQKRIAEGADVSQRTVNGLIREMMEEGLLSSIQSGVYRLDPDLIWRGSSNSRMNILMQFEKELPNDDEEEEEIEPPDLLPKTPETGC